MMETVEHEPPPATMLALWRGDKSEETPTMSTMTTAPKRPPTHDEAVTIAVAASGLAGHDASLGSMDLLDRIGRGELTYDEAVAEVIAEFGQPAE